MLLIISLVVAHLIIAYLLQSAALWVILLAAYGGGAFLAASLNAMIHEASHALIFKRRVANHVAAVIANMPLVVLSAVPFFRYHQWHHKALGDYKLDVGIPTEWEARWVGNKRLRKTIWLACFPFFHFLRTIKFNRGGVFWHRWMLGNLLMQLSVNVTLLWVWGPKALVYLFLS
jgi:sphingolipid delta-4 desaturase